MGTLQLACAADRGYVGHTAAMLHSTLTAGGELPVQVHFLHGPRLPGRYRRRMEEMVVRLGGAIRFYELPDERVRGLGTPDDVSMATWYRIHLPELLPDAERVLYLDSDTLVVDTLDELWATDLGDHLVAAVTNVVMPDPAVRARLAALELNNPYFNVGVVLLNLDAMRRDGTTAKLRDFALSHELAYADQDAMNGVMGERRLALHPRWNCMNSLMVFPWASDVLGAEAVEEARRRPAIRHFEGPGRNKPWHRDYDFPSRELYFEHRRETPWPRVRLVDGGSSWGERLRRWAGLQ